MRVFLVLLALFAPGGLFAETLVAARTIRAQAILTPSDLAVIEQTVPGSLAHIDQALGMETRVVLYSGRPVRPGDISPPAIVDRNQIVPLYFRRGGLTIVAEARSMDRGGVGDVIRLINIMSRSIVSGTVRADGSVRVGGPDINLLN